MVTIQAVYEGQLHCRATHGPSKSTLVTDAPVDNMGKGEAFSPTDLVGTALGTCILTILGIVAQRNGLSIEGATAVVEKEMAQQPLRRIGRLAVRIRMPAGIPVEHRQRLENAARTCPVHQSLHPDVDAPIIFEWA